MNRGNRAAFCIGKKHWNAVGGLYGKKESANARDQRVTGKRVRRNSIDQMNRVGMNLAQRDQFHFGSAKRAKKRFAIQFHGFALVPFREAKIQSLRRAL